MMSRMYKNTVTINIIIVWVKTLSNMKRRKTGARGLKIFKNVVVWY